MILLILALFWVALLAPVVVGRLREGSSERSIDHFHAEHEMLSRQDYRVAPANRLEVREPPREVPRPVATAPRPRLRVVHADDTVRSLEARSSWREWQEDYEYDDPYAYEDPHAVTEEAPNRYARAYTTHPQSSDYHDVDEPRRRRRSMRARRRVVFLRLVAAAIVTTLAAALLGYSLFVYLAVATWLGVVLFVALAMYAVSQGHLAEESLPVRIPGQRTLARVEPLYRDDYDHFAARAGREYDDVDVEPDYDGYYASRRVRAFG